MTINYGWQLPFRSRSINERASPEQVKQRFLRHQANDVTPLAVTHERIYILPSSRGWLFLLSLLVMLITSINYSLSLGYALCFLLTGLFSATLLATYRNVAGIIFNSVQGNGASVGETVDFQITIANQRTQPCYALEVQTDRSSIAQCQITQNDEQSINLQLHAEQRGWQKLGRITLRSSYPLGLIVTWGYAHFDAAALVWPAIEQPAPALPGDSEQTAPDNNAQVTWNKATQGEFAMLRDYVPGDSLSAIAWKSAARGLGLHTREFEESSGPGELQLHWSATAALGDTEKRLSRLASWCNECQNRNIGYSLILPAVTIDAATGTEHHRRCMRHLALFGMDLES